MPNQINVNIRMDKDIKEQADSLFNELGFNMTTAINAFVRQALRERAIPFQIKSSAQLTPEPMLSPVAVSAPVPTGITMPLSAPPPAAAAASASAPTPASAPVPASPAAAESHKEETVRPSQEEREAALLAAASDPRGTGTHKQVESFWAAYDSYLDSLGSKNSDKR